MYANDAKKAQQKDYTMDIGHAMRYEVKLFYLHFDVYFW